MQSTGLYSKIIGRIYLVIFPETDLTYVLLHTNNPQGILSLGQNLEPKGLQETPKDHQLSPPNPDPVNITPQL